jgi:acyl-CoA thioesterase-1
MCPSACSPRPLGLGTIAAFILFAGGCGEEAVKSPERVAAPPPVPARVEPAPLAPSPEAKPAPGPTVVFLGDSLTAGFGLAAEEAYPALVTRLLAERELPVRTINAGVSGDTTAGGFARLDWLLAQHPAIVFVCLGGNDGLRGLPLEATEANLDAIVGRSLAAGAQVVLAGMQIPPNYGPEYVAGFRAIFPRLAQKYDLPLVPFLLEGVAADPRLNQPDGIHPNAQGQRIVAETVARALAPLVADAARRAG